MAEKIAIELTMDVHNDDPRITAAWSCPFCDYSPVMQTVGTWEMYFADIVGQAVNAIWLQIDEHEDICAAWRGFADQEWKERTGGDGDN